MSIKKQNLVLNLRRLSLSHIGQNLELTMTTEIIFLKNQFDIICTPTCKIWTLSIL